MDIQDFKKQYVQEELGVNDEFKKILTFVDFGNVNYWFKEDRQTHEHIALADDEEFYINIEKLKEFPDSYRQFTTRDFRAELDKYRLDYILSVGPLPDKTQADLGGVAEVFLSGDIFIYKF